MITHNFVGCDVEYIWNDWKIKRLQQINNMLHTKSMIKIMLKRILEISFYCKKVKLYSCVQNGDLVCQFN